jgi:hypothetical protein
LGSPYKQSDLNRHLLGHARFIAWKGIEFNRKHKQTAVLWAFKRVERSLQVLRTTRPGSSFLIIESPKESSSNDTIRNFSFLFTYWVQSRNRDHFKHFTSYPLQM